MPYSANDSSGVPLEVKIDELFKQKTNGFFIELGANNGLFQSNTAFLERVRNWKGILIEPSLKGYNECKTNRPGSICLNYACVSSTYTDEFVHGDFQHNHPMASVNGERCNPNTPVSLEQLCKVKANTLEKILDEHSCSAIDFLSLDTEGYELNILQGLNLNKYRPTYLLIEIYPKEYDGIIDFLNQHKYRLHSTFSNYTKVTNPGWDGLHNDYMFVDTTTENI